MSKTCPSCGYHETDNQSLYCNKCGYPFPQQPSQRPLAAAPANRPAQRFPKRPVPKKTGIAAFLSFETLLTMDRLRLIYIVGAVMIILVSLMGITGGFAKKGAIPGNMSFTNTTAAVQEPASSSLFWTGFLVIGSVLWRMFCELFVLLSRLQGSAGSSGEAVPYEETDPYEEEYAAVQSAGETPVQYVECPRCSKVVPVDQLRECEHCGVKGCSNCIRMMGLLKKTMTCRECFEAK